MDPGFSGIIFSLLGCWEKHCEPFFLLDAKEGAVHSQYLRFSSPEAPGVLCEAMIGDNIGTYLPHNH